MKSSLAAQAVSRAGRFALDLIYPPRCAICRRGGEFLCAPCLDALPRAAAPRCKVCWLPWDGRFCPACDAHPVAIDALRAPFVYDGNARSLVHEFKFRNFSALAEALAWPMVEAARAASFAAQAVIPVPLSGPHERQRGYNQARLLARRIARELGLPMTDVLKRPRSLRPQSLTPDAAARRRNVDGAFIARERARVARRVLLVDDVATTGATLDACARALRASGAQWIGALTFAREDA